MDQPSLFVKIAAIASSLVLGAALVAYNAGVFDGFDVNEGRIRFYARTSSEYPPARPADSPAAASTTTPPADSLEPADREFIPSSKSSVPMIHFRDADSSGNARTEPAVDSAARRRALFYGSKSGAPAVNVPDPDTNDKAGNVREEPRALMGGSKSLAPLIKVKVDSGRATKGDSNRTPVRKP